MFNKLASRYHPLTNSTPVNSMPNSEDEANEAKMILDEEEIGTLEESSISFRLNEPNEE